MLVRHCDPLSASKIESEEVSGLSMEVMLGRENGAQHFAIRHLVIEAGGHSSKHHHDWEHEVYMVEGVLMAECDGVKKEIKAGDVVLIPCGSTHQFVNETNQPARFICVVPTDAPSGKPVPWS